MQPVIVLPWLYSKIQTDSLITVWNTIAATQPPRECDKAALLQRLVKETVCRIKVVSSSSLIESYLHSNSYASHCEKLYIAKFVFLPCTKKCEDTQNFVWVGKLVISTGIRNEENVLMLFAYRVGRSIIRTLKRITY